MGAWLATLARTQCDRGACCCQPYARVDTTERHALSSKLEEVKSLYQEKAR